MRRRIVTTTEGETLYVTIDGDMLDHIAHAYYGKHARNTEAILNANPGLASYPPVLPAGLVIKLPAVDQAVSQQAYRQLWD